MEPFIVQGTIKLAEGIFYLITNPKDYHPERLSGNMLSLFQKFKTSYDSKDATKLTCLISDSYSGSLYGVKSKSAFIQLFEHTYKSFPNFMYPSLTINVYQITKNSDEVFGAIMDFKSNVKVAFVSISSIDSGQVYVEARPDGDYGMWRITSINTIQG